MGIFLGGGDHAASCPDLIFPGDKREGIQILSVFKMVLIGRCRYYLDQGYLLDLTI